MASFLDLWSLRRKAEKTLSTYEGLINDTAKEQSSLKAFFNSQCQPLAKFWKFASKRGTWTNSLIRVTVSFLLCHFVGILFYFTLTLKYVVNPQIAGTYISLAIQLTLAAILLIPLLRVTIILSIPSLLTGRLRTVLLVIIVSWALQIPATNITSNIRNTVEGVACVQERIKQSSQEMRQFAAERLKTMTQTKFDKFIRKAYQPFVKMRDTLRQLEETVNKMIAWQREMIKNVEGIFQSCDEFMKIPYYKCNSIIENMYYRCMDVTFDSICLPIRLLNKICQSTRVLSLHCEWPKALKNQLEENVGVYVKQSLQRTIDAAKNTTYYRFYSDTKDAVVDSIDSANSVQINVDYEHETKDDFDANLDEIKQKLREEIAIFESFVNVVLFLLDMLIYVIFISPFISAIIYTVRFNRNDKMDNYFLNNTLHQLDTKRQANGKTSLFPLLPAERAQYINSASVHITAKERRWLMWSIVMTILSGAIPACLIFADILCYHITAKGHDFFHSDLTRIDPPNMYELKVSGDGFMAELLSNLLDVFVPFSSGRRSEIWRDCFSEPTPPDYALFQLMFLVYVLAFLLCFVQTYAKRTRHLIALNYFPERDRPRAVKLYNLILNNRRKVLDEFMDRRKKHEKTKPQNAEINIDDDVQTCIRCSRSDLTLKNGSNTRVCIHCNSFYCIDCYSVRNKCIYCKETLQKLEETLELYVDSSCSDLEDEKVHETTAKEVIDSVSKAATQTKIMMTDQTPNQTKLSNK